MANYFLMLDDVSVNSETLIDQLRESQDQVDSVFQICL
jgi:hypothetical protein